MDIQVVARIQAHPSRNHLHQDLARALALPTEIMVHESDPPSPWDGYKACLSNLPDCSHLLIVQDDVQICRDFAKVISQVAERNKSVPVVLFLGGFPQGTASRARRAWLKNQRYVPLHPSPIIPLVAVLWPRAKCQEFLEWAESGVKLVGHPTPRADDGIAAQWMKATKQEVLVTVPSIVQHLDNVPSVKGGEPSRWGADRNRVAALYEEDAAKYDWRR